MSDGRRLKIQYNLLQKPGAVLITSVCSVMLYQGLYYLHPGNQDWVHSEHFSWGNTLKFLLVDQILIEFLTIIVVFQIIRIYSKTFKLDSVEIKAGDITRYLLAFIPVVFVAFFVFNPITQTARFVYHFYPDLDDEVYFNSYWYSSSLYFSYLFPVFLEVYGILAFNLFQLYHGEMKNSPGHLSNASMDENSGSILAFDDWGEVPVAVDKVHWIERIERKCYLFTTENKYTVKDTIQGLEERLTPMNFARINRSVIVNMSQIKNYSFWENEKYILRMKNEREFVMSRERLNSLKKELKLI